MKKKITFIATISLSLIALTTVIKTRTSVVRAEETSSEPTVSETVKTTDSAIQEFTNSFVTPVITSIASLDVIAIIAFIGNMIVSKKREKTTYKQVENMLEKTGVLSANTINSIQALADQLKEIVPTLIDTTETCVKVSQQFQTIVKDFAKQIKNNTITMEYLNDLYQVLITIEKDIVTHTKELVANGSAEKVCGLINTLKGLKNEKKN